jgi:hypothetical protein
MPSVGYGGSYALGDHLIVGDNEEIPIGNYAYVFNQQIHGETLVPKLGWDAMVSGDFTAMKRSIEQGIPGSQVKMIKCSWDYARPVHFPIIGSLAYAVSGFKVEALVQNRGAQLTGVEIAVIIFAVAWLAGVIAVIAFGGWSIWKVVTAAEQAFGPIGVVIVGGVILIGIFLIAMTLIGGRVRYKGKTRSLSVGRHEDSE